MTKNKLKNLKMSNIIIQENINKKIHLLINSKIQIQICKTSKFDKKNKNLI